VRPGLLQSAPSVPCFPGRSITLVTSLAFFCLAVFCTLWHPKDSDLSTNDHWIDVTILFSTCISIILLLIALCKLICGRGELFAARSDYEEINDGGVSPRTPQLSVISPQMRFSSAAKWSADDPRVAMPAALKFDAPTLAVPGGHPGAPAPMVSARGPAPLDRGLPKQQPAPASARLDAGESRTSPRCWSQEPAARVASSQQKADNASVKGFVAGRGGMQLRPVELVPLADGAIDSGIELEKSDHQFLHQGLCFDAGTWRVLQVRKGSCCDRQGTCGPGDIILSLNGVPIAGVGDLEQVASLLRGRAGSAISIEVIHADCRHAMARQLILAPSPADFGISTRSTGSRAIR
jgi:hypothetical protein